MSIVEAVENTVETAAADVEHLAAKDEQAVVNEVSEAEELFLTKAKLALAKIDNRYAAIKLEEQALKQESQAILQGIDTFVVNIAKRLGKDLTAEIFDIEKMLWIARPKS